MIILDTNVLSELLRASPNTAVLQWMAAQKADSLCTTAITQAEMLYGAALLPPGQRRRQLLISVTALFDQDFAGRTLGFDSQAATHYGQIVATRKQAGRPISPLDAQIAAIALANGCELATRNVDDFDGCGVVVVNPWLPGV